MLTIVLLRMQTKEQQRQKQTENAKNNKQTNKQTESRKGLGTRLNSKYCIAGNISRLADF